MQSGLAVLVVVAVVLAIFSGWRDYRRNRRIDLDRIGWVDWRTIQMFALIAAVGFAIIAQHG